MAESTSRSPHKLEYTSCISTTIPSPTSITTYHSSFDFISEPRNCDTLVTINNNNYKKLERDLRRVDLNNKEKKSHKLNRTESISLPTTPTEQLSPILEYKYPHFDIDDQDSISYSKTYRYIFCFS